MRRKVLACAFVVLVEKHQIKFAPTENTERCYHYVGNCNLHVCVCVCVTWEKGELDPGQ